MEPLDLEWRKFYRLLSTMPIDSSLFYSSRTEEESDEPEQGWWKEEFDRRRGRRRDRVPTTIDQMMGDQQRIARNDGTSNDR